MSSAREVWLMVDVTLWVLLILASVLLIVGIVIYNHWLLAPWMLLMAIGSRKSKAIF